MNAPAVMQKCPTEEVLAAFIDGRLEESSRQQVIEHLADCGECRDVVMTANEYSSSEVPQSGGEVVRGPFGRRVLAPLLAVAAVVAVVFGVPSIRERILPKSDMEELVAAANGLPERPTYGRLSANFPYKGKKTMRNAGDDNVLESADVYDAAAKIAERAEKKPTPANLHAEGVASLFTNDKKRAVEALTAAAKADPSSADIQNDLAAAHIARGDYELAQAAATKAFALKQTPAAAWNIALALEYQGDRQADAKAAWEKYLQLDSNSEWAKEVREKHLPLLQEQ